MNRIIATIAIATATVTGFAAPSFAGLLSGAEKAQVERMTGISASNLSVSDQAFIHGLIASGELSKATSANRIRAVIAD